MNKDIWGFLFEEGSYGIPNIVGFGVIIPAMIGFMVWLVSFMISDLLPS